MFKAARKAIVAKFTTKKEKDKLDSRRRAIFDSLGGDLQTGLDNAFDQEYLRKFLDEIQETRIREGIEQRMETASARQYALRVSTSQYNDYVVRQVRQSEIFTFERKLDGYELITVENQAEFEVDFGLLNDRLEDIRLESEKTRLEDMLKRIEAKWRKRVAAEGQHLMPAEECKVAPRRP